MSLNLRRLGLVIGVFVLLAGFQNCGNVGFNGANSSSLSKASNQTDVNQPGEPSGDHADDYIDVNVPADSVDQLSKNEACASLLAKVDPSKFPHQDALHVNGVSGDILVANVDDLKINGIARLIAAKNIGNLQISGVYGSVCVQAETIKGISGVIFGGKQDIAVIGPADHLGTADHFSGVTGSDLVVIHFDTAHIDGVGRSLHIYGGHVGKIAGVFEQIHLYDGAVVDQINGLNRGVVRH